MENANYYSITSKDGQFKGAIRTILPLEEIAELAEWTVNTYGLKGERMYIFTKDGCYVIPHRTDPTKGRGSWEGVGDSPVVEVWSPVNKKEEW